MDVGISEMFRINHRLSKENYEALQKLEVGITTAMTFSY